MKIFSLYRFARSFSHAARGLKRAVTTENSFRIHLVAATVVVILMFFVELQPIEIALIIMVIATILVLELVNTIVERFVDILEPRVHPYVGVIKDLMAAAVLIVAVAAVFIAGLVLLPAVWR